MSRVCEETLFDLWKCIQSCVVICYLYTVTRLWRWWGKFNGTQETCISRMYQWYTLLITFHHLFASLCAVKFLCTLVIWHNILDTCQLIPVDTMRYKWRHSVQYPEMISNRSSKSIITAQRMANKWQCHTSRGGEDYIIFIGSDAVNMWKKISCCTWNTLMPYAVQMEHIYMSSLEQKKKTRITFKIKSRLGEMSIHYIHKIVFS